MTKKRDPRRPTESEAADRRRQTAAAALTAVIGDAKKLAALSKKLGDSRDMVSRDLATVRDELERPPELPSDLAAVLSRAETVKEVAAATVSARAARVAGAISDRQHAAIVASLKLQLAAIKQQGPDTVDPIAEALDVLTPQEVEAVERYRASVRTPALRPGESPPPPPPEEEGTAIRPEEEETMARREPQ